MLSPTEHRLWHVPEMLEAILAELPMKDLLLSQAVCRAWKNGIETSAKLQKKLFLVADGAIWPSIYISDSWQTKGSHSPKFTFNPPLRKFVDSSRSGKLFRVRDGNLEVKGQQECPESWTKMLLTQPPLQMHLVTPCWEENLRHGGKMWQGRKAWAHNSNGLTIGDVIRSVRMSFPTLSLPSFHGVDLCYLKNDELWENWKDGGDESKHVGTGEEGDGTLWRFGRGNRAIQVVTPSF